MCGAFEQHLSAMQDWGNLLQDWPSSQEALFNIRPTTQACTLDAEGFKLRRWSLLPKWAKDPKLKYSTFNARSETLTEKPTFRDAWRRSQRCIVPASAYFEWPVVGGQKQCHRVYSEDTKPLLFGGLWETWRHDDTTIESFTVITTPAIPEIEWVHHRTPLLISEAMADSWLTGSVEDAAELLKNNKNIYLTARAIASPPKTA
jgi:putative SOS response-associated peptidase YedK